jgi:biopolymer transport protein ExbB/TolQ
MDVIRTLLDLCLLTGAAWVLWLLVGLSVLSIALIVERALFFARLRVDLTQVTEQLRKDLAAGELERAGKRLEAVPGVETRIALEGLRAYAGGPDAVAEAMTAAKAAQRVWLERHLAFLGTLGNNAPFIGLFGTVIGIIKAFHDLSLDNSSGAKVVMAGISEALVATALGLFVAIPAVVAFNTFQRRIRARLAASDSLAHLLLSDLRGRMHQDRSAGGPP